MLWKSRLLFEFGSYTFYQFLSDKNCKSSMSSPQCTLTFCLQLPVASHSSQVTICLFFGEVFYEAYLLIEMKLMACGLFLKEGSTFQVAVFLSNRTAISFKWHFCFALGRWQRSTIWCISHLLKVTLRFVCLTGVLGSGQTSLLFYRKLVFWEGWCESR